MLLSFCIHFCCVSQVSFMYSFSMLLHILLPFWFFHFTFETAHITQLDICSIGLVLRKPISMCQSVLSSNKCCPAHFSSKGTSSYLQMKHSKLDLCLMLIKELIFVVLRQMLEPILCLQGAPVLPWFKVMCHRFWLCVFFLFVTFILENNYKLQLTWLIGIYAMSLDIERIKSPLSQV